MNLNNLNIKNMNQIPQTRKISYQWWKTVDNKTKRSLIISNRINKSPFDLTGSDIESLYKKVVNKF